MLLDEIGHTATLKTSITSLANSIALAWRTESITLGKNALGHSTESLHVPYYFYITFWDRSVRYEVLSHKKIIFGNSSATELLLSTETNGTWKSSSSEAFLKNTVKGGILIYSSLPFLKLLSKFRADRSIMITMASLGLNPIPISNF